MPGKAAAQKGKSAFQAMRIKRKVPRTAKLAARDV